jgi:hypothetical protein
VLIQTLCLVTNTWQYECHVDCCPLLQGCSADFLENPKSNKGQGLTKSVMSLLNHIHGLIAISIASEEPLILLNCLSTVSNQYLKRYSFGIGSLKFIRQILCFLVIKIICLVTKNVLHHRWWYWNECTYWETFVSKSTGPSEAMLPCTRAMQIYQPSSRWNNFVKVIHSRHTENIWWVKYILQLHEKGKCTSGKVHSSWCLLNLIMFN